MKKIYLFLLLSLFTTQVAGAHLCHILPDTETEMSSCHDMADNENDVKYEANCPICSMGICELDLIFTGSKNWQSRDFQTEDSSYQGFEISILYSKHFLQEKLQPDSYLAYHLPDNWQSYYSVYRL